MKISCEIIKDLLPLYYDVVCSMESKVMVEEHLVECENCRFELLSMGEMLPMINKNQNLNEAEILKKLSKKWRIGKLKSFVKGALITVIVLVLIVLILSIFSTIRITAV